VFDTSSSTPLQVTGNYSSLHQRLLSLPDGTLLIDASISLRDLKEDHQIALPESTEYETLGGFLMTTLQKILKVGDVVVTEGERINIVEMVGQRISKVKLHKLLEAPTMDKSSAEESE
jgi:putative hemolysin